MSTILSSSTLRQAGHHVNVWLGRTLFNSASLSSHFEFVAEGIDPMWSLEATKARIEAITHETPDTKTFTLRPVRSWQGFAAGQHASLSLAINGRQMTRVFSLSSAPAQWQQQGTVSMTIKQIPDGKVTGWLHHALRVGEVVTLGPAQGEFLLPTLAQGHTLYIAGGSGVTPILSHLRSLLAQGFPYPVTLLYYARSPEHWIQAELLRAIAKQVKHFHLYLISTDEPNLADPLTGPICREHLQKSVPNTPDRIYLCGPSGFAQATRDHLQAVGFHDIPTYSEHFSLTANSAACAAPDASVRFTRSDVQAINGSAGNLLELAEQQGLTPQYGCRMGICHTCKCTKTQGRVRNQLTGEVSGDGTETIQLCISTPETDVEIAL